MAWAEVDRGGFSVAEPGFVVGTGFGAAVRLLKNVWARTGIWATAAMDWYIQALKTDHVGFGTLSVGLRLSQF